MQADPSGAVRPKCFEPRTRQAGVDHGLASVAAFTDNETVGTFTGKAVIGV